MSIHGIFSACVLHYTVQVFRTKRKIFGFFFLSIDAGPSELTVLQYIFVQSLYLPFDAFTGFVAERKDFLAKFRKWKSVFCLYDGANFLSLWWMPSEKRKTTKTRFRANGIISNENTVRSDTLSLRLQSIAMILSENKNRFEQ